MEYRPAGAMMRLSPWGDLHTGYGTPSRAHAPGALSCLDPSSAGRDSAAAYVLAADRAVLAGRLSCFREVPGIPGGPGSVRFLPRRRDPARPRTTLTWSDRCRSYGPPPIGALSRQVTYGGHAFSPGPQLQVKAGSICSLSVVVPGPLASAGTLW